MADITFTVSIKDMITGAKVDSAVKEGVKQSLKLIERMFIAKSREGIFKKPTGAYFGQRMAEITSGGMGGVFAPTVAHARYVEEGAPASTGRYVPWLITSGGSTESKISTGVHPGYKGYHIMEKLRDESKPEIQRLVQNIIGMRLKL